MRISPMSIAVFDDDDAAFELGVVRIGECFADLAGEEIEAFVFGPLDPIAGSADDAMDRAAVAVRFAEEPLHGSAHEGRVRRGEHWTVERQMCAEDRNALQLAQSGEARIELR